ncbi:MAG: radical SAM protein [Candidatus Accumulibacter sp. UW20]|jgi:radical SAM protein with 4Fe4S-binding SPASM domain
MLKTHQNIGVASRLKKSLASLIKQTGFRYEHVIIPKYYLPYVFLDGIAEKAPIQCDFEVTYRCNMYCDMCPQVSHREQHLHGGQIRRLAGGTYRSELSTKEIKSAISDLAEGGTKIVLFSGGEPFLRKDLCNILEHAKHLGLNVTIITNGSLITPSIAEHLVRIGVDAITFSLDGPKDLHNKIRNLANGFDSLGNSIRLLQSEKARQETERPYLSISSVIQQQNQGQLAEIVDTAQQLGVKNLNLNFPFYTTPELELATWEKLKPRFRQGAKPEEQSNLNGHRNLVPEAVLSQLADSRKRAALHGISINTSPQLEDREIPEYIEDPTFSVVHKCFYSWKTMRVNAWGDVYPCSIDVHLGNIREQGILDLWNGEPYREFRRTVKKNKLFSQCAKCCVLTNRIWNRLPVITLGRGVLRPLRLTKIKEIFRRVC